ncbi:hypothetical protein ACFL21_04255 [Patescibacteria group bacterium]
MSQLILNRGVNSKNFIKRFLSKIETGPYLLIFSLVTFVVLITVITLVFSTRQVTKGYALNYLESEHQKLIRQQETHDMQISQVRSLNYIEDSEKVKSMVNPDLVVFVDGNTAIAQK